MDNLPCSLNLRNRCACESEGVASVYILSTENHISDIQTIVDGETREHCLGFMQWDSLTQNFEYSNMGLIKSLSELSNHLADEFST